MNLTTSVKYLRIARKILKGLLWANSLLLLYLIFQYFRSGNLYTDGSLLPSVLFINFIFVILIVIEIINYSQKYHEVSTNDNYLKVRQNETISVSTGNTHQLLEKLESEILSRKPNWLLSGKFENLLEFQTRKKSVINYFLEDRIRIKVCNSNTIDLESAPVNKLIFIDNARNLSHILFLKKLIKKLRP